MTRKKNPNKIPQSHLEEDKASPGEETGEQAVVRQENRVPGERVLKPRKRPLKTQ